MFACCDGDSVNWKAELSLTKMTFGCQEDDIPMPVASYTWRRLSYTVVHLEAPFSTLSIRLPMGSDNAFARKKPTRWRLVNMANICQVNSKLSRLSHSFEHFPEPQGIFPEPQSTKMHKGFHSGSWLHWAQFDNFVALIEWWFLGSYFIQE